MCHGSTNAYSVNIFWITFDKNKIESCGFHRSKEEMKMHRIVLLVCGHGFLKVFNRHLWKRTYSIRCFQRILNCQGCIQTAGGILTKLKKFKILCINHSGVIDALVEARSDFSSNLCEERKKMFSILRKLIEEILR